MALAKAMQRHHQSEWELDQAARRVECARRSQQGTGPSTAADMIARQAYLERVEGEHRSSVEDLHRHEQAVAGHRDALTEAAQARQVLERLKAKVLDQHRREQERIEHVALDEIATNGFRRKAAAA